ncbi:hypothetical protein F9C07_8306 [Aspergillus flavus]|uniref:Uncharacterized protein n=1 Tax=Aspergillus flavus (strain ATCC 200026 / FGSC A1120 / IAM 13836 / NRRL 3357 / JCM 12722 / SRRC 167) TaxID=332952 RepID=A0A7U2N1Q1_ASPFN|nr:hypothetical protein F9C07_8306 [Aspergillus flavus]
MLFPGMLGQRYYMHAIQGGMDSRGKPMVIAGAGIMDVLRMVLICMYIGNWHSLINFNAIMGPLKGGDLPQMIFQFSSIWAILL